MQPRKLKLVVSDFHLGSGRYTKDGTLNILEDFWQDEKFIEFLEYHRSGEFLDADVELIINGDFFNFLSVAIQNQFVERITEPIALQKLDRVLAGHRNIFDALQLFAKSENKQVAFILGNHDPEIYFKAIQEKLKEIIDVKIKFFYEAYNFDGIHIEHGHQFEPVNQMDSAEYTIKSANHPEYLRLPWGSMLVIHVVSKIKTGRPFVDKVRPFGFFIRWVLLNDLFFFLRYIFRAMFFVFTSWFRFREEKYGFFRLMKKIFRSSTFPSLDKAAIKLLRKNDFHTVILGHSHIPKYVQLMSFKHYFNTGTWTKVTNLDIEGFGSATRRTYAFIEYSDNQPKTYLREWYGRHRVFEEVIN